MKNTLLFASNDLIISNDLPSWGLSRHRTWSLSPIGLFLPGTLSSLLPWAHWLFDLLIQPMFFPLRRTGKLCNCCKEVVNGEAGGVGEAYWFCGQWLWSLWTAWDRQAVPRRSKALIWRREKRPMGVSISNKHSTTRQKQERVLTVMPIDRSALHTVRKTSWPIRFVWRQTRCNCKELQTAERTARVNTTSSVGTHFCSVLHIDKKSGEGGNRGT